MKKFVFSKAVVIALMTGGLITSTATQSTAVQETFQAAVEILSPLAIAENTKLDFGQIVKPSSGSGENTFLLDPNTGTITPGGAGDGSHVNGSQTVGILDISDGGPSGNSVAVTDVSTLPGGCSLAGVTLEAITIDGTPGNTNFSVNVGGTVKVTDVADTGTGTCNYTVQALFN